MRNKKQALLRLRRALSSLLSSQPFFATLALRMPFIADPTRKTLASDGTHIRYNPDWVMESHGDEVKFAMSRIVLACALKHHLRRGDRHYQKWQMASHMVTTPLLRDAGLTDEQGGVEMSVEQAYNTLPDMPDDDQPSQGDGDGEGGGDQQGKGQGDQDGDQDGDGQGDGKQPPPSFDPDGKGEIMDAPRPEQMSDGEYGEHCKKEEQEWDEAQAQAQQMAKRQGNMPGNVSQMIDAQHVHTIDWRSLLQRFMMAFAKDDYSWARPNRRFISQGLYLPALHSQAMPPIVFAIDTSGSLNEEALSAIWSEIRGAAEILKPENVTVIQCDHDIQDVQKYHPDELPEKIMVKGRGGTAFKPVFSYIAEMDLNPMPLIYLTDLGIPPDSYPPDPGYPVIWAVVDPWGDPPNPPFGERIDIKM